PSPAADLFAAGAVLWEALCGRPMRQQGDLVGNRFGTAPLPAEVRTNAGKLAEVIAALTALEPERRPSAEGALKTLA
ncbi:MAG TPA: serine/threonine protein kinase, partial [Polyangia bacterium]|nr:serine/threonine protein kinase [Polyangia bacterium]